MSGLGGFGSMRPARVSLMPGLRYRRLAAVFREKTAIHSQYCEIFYATIGSPRATAAKEHYSNNPQFYVLHKVARVCVCCLPPHDCLRN